MQKLLILTISMCLSVSSVFADESSTALENMTQPTPKKQILQSNMKAVYLANEKSLTDTVRYTIGSKTWSTKGPWSLASESMRKKVRDCKNKSPGATASTCGWYDYSILRLSPSGTYIELVGVGYESNIWRMLSTKTGKIILSNDNGVEKSMWTADKKQFMWKTMGCEIGGCVDPQGTFLTEYGNFPKFKQINQ